MIYVDDYEGRLGRMIMCHMVSDDSVTELLEFAKRLGLKQDWFQNQKWYQTKKIPHFDLSKSKRAEAIKLGAVDLPITIDGKANQHWCDVIAKARSLPRPLSPRQMIARAMQHPDQHVCEIVYQDAQGVRLRRAISPIRYVDRGRHAILALCLCREEPRRFRFTGIESMKLVDANEALMPTKIERVD